MAPLIQLVMSKTTNPSVSLLIVKDGATATANSPPAHPSAQSAAEFPTSESVGQFHVTPGPEPRTCWARGSPQTLPVPSVNGSVRLYAVIGFPASPQLPTFSAT